MLTVTEGVRIKATTLLGLSILAVLALIAFRAPAQDLTAGSTDVQQYRIMEPHELVFNSLQLAESALISWGEDGWIFPDTTQVIAHTFNPGTPSEYTNFCIRTAFPYTEAAGYVVARRPVR